MSREFARDYIDVATRISAFRERFPDGSLQSEIVHLGDNVVVMKGIAYRTPDDVRPGIGHSAMSIPGPTSFSRGSEIENAETSAWGRALAALGFEVRAGVATSDEIRSKSNDAPARPAQAAPARAAGNDEDGMTLGQALDLLKARNVDPKAVSAKGRELYGQWQLKSLTPAQRAHVVEELIGSAPLPLVSEEEEW